jgi:hypothetical protein
MRSRSGWGSRGWNATRTPAATWTDWSRPVVRWPIGAACAAVRRALGSTVFAVSAAEMVAACSGGSLLAARFPATMAKWINTSPHL